MPRRQELVSTDLQGGTVVLMHGRATKFVVTQFAEQICEKVKIPGFRNAMTTTSSYLAPDHPGMALSHAFPSLPANGFNPYDVRHQQHPFVNEPTSSDSSEETTRLVSVMRSRSTRLARKYLMLFVIE